MTYFLAVFAASFWVALSGAMMPGPLLTVTVSQTARRGFIASVLLVLGHSLLELLLVLALVLGFGHVLEIRLLKGAISLLGGSMLLWMGATMVRDARRGILDLHLAATDGGTPAQTGVLRSSILTGAIVSLTNPYWLMWWATIGLTFFAALTRNAFGAIAAFYLGHITGDIAWYMAVGGAVSSGRRLMSPSVYRSIVQVCGVFLVFLGGCFLYSLASGRIWAVHMNSDSLTHLIDGIKGRLGGG